MLILYCAAWPTVFSSSVNHWILLRLLDGFASSRCRCKDLIFPCGIIFKAIRRGKNQSQGQNRVRIRWLRPSSLSLLLSFEAVISESLKSSFGLSFPSISLQIRTKRGKKLSCIRALMSRNSYQMGSFVLRRKLPFFHSSISRNPNYHTFFLSIRSFYCI